MVDDNGLTLDLVRRLPIVRRLQEALWRGPQPRDTRLSVDDLVDFVRKDRNVEIDVRSVPFRAERLVSLIERKSEKRFLIAVREDAPFIERRYGVVKEICHLVGDEPDDYQPRGDLTLNFMLKQDTASLYGRTLDLGGDGRGVPSEKRAERMADELIYDRRLRLADTVRIKAGKIQVPEICSAYGISSELYVRVTRPLAMELMQDLWREAGLD